MGAHEDPELRKKSVEALRAAHTFLEGYAASRPKEEQQRFEQFALEVADVLGRFAALTEPQ